MPREADAPRPEPSAREKAGLRFEEVAAAMAARPGVSFGSGRPGFGREALYVGGRIFCFPGKVGLIMKIPAARLEELALEGRAGPWEAGKRRPYREWAVVEPGDDLPLAEEAYLFVASLPT